ncbi:MAG: cupin domain-containing protein [Pseudomonadota bacterium]
MSQSENFYSLHDPDSGIPRQLAPGITTQIFAGEQAMFSVVSFAPGSRGSIHHHPEEQWGVMLEGTGTRIQSGEEFAVSQGDFWCTPPNVEHGVVAGPEGAKVLDVFAPPREAYRKAGAGFS